MNTMLGQRFLKGWRPIRTGRLVSLLILTSGITLQAQFDDFNDGNDEGWTHYCSLSAYGISGLYSFTNGGYRLQTANSSPVPGRYPDAVSLRTSNFTDFYLQVDLVAWDPSLTQIIGVGARLANLGLGTTTGYLLLYSTLSQRFFLTRDDSDSPTFLVTSPYGLDPAKDYRIVFLGAGDYLEARVYELPEQVERVRLFAEDNKFPSGRVSLMVSGFNTPGLSDATFDNFLVTEKEEPPALSLQRSEGTLLVSWPAPSTGYALQCCSSLSPTNWSTIRTEFMLSADGRSWVCLTNYTAGSLFFRLKTE